VADIEITCPNCATVTTISEFVDDAKLQCRSCGAHLEKPGALAQAAKCEGTPVSPPPPTQSGLRLAKRQREYTAPPTDEGDNALKAIVEAPATQGQTVPLELRPEIKDDTRRINHAAIAAALFVVLGGAMGYLRYGNILPEDILALTVEYSWIAFVAFHAMIVLKAMTDNIMQGILCLLVPGYSLFYIFTISDDFYLRAALAGLLVGIGQDTSIKLTAYASTITQIVNGFIAEGGGSIR